MAKLGRDLSHRRLHSDLHHLRTGENLGRARKNRPAKPLLDDAVVFHIPVAKKPTTSRDIVRKLSNAIRTIGSRDKKPPLPRPRPLWLLLRVAGILTLMAMNTTEYQFRKQSRVRTNSEQRVGTGVCF